MKIIRVVVGDLDANCYVLIEENKCLVIDPGGNAEKSQITNRNTTDQIEQNQDSQGCQRNNQLG